MEYLQQSNLGRGLSLLIMKINDGADGERIGEDLFGVADLLRSDASLSRALTDPSRDGLQRQRLAADVFGEAISTEAMQLVHDLVGDHWSDPIDLAASLARLGLDSFILVSVQDDKGVSLSEELVLASRLIADNRQLRIQLSDLGEGAADDRSALAGKVFQGRVSPVAQRLLQRAAFTSGYGRILQTLRSYAERSAELKGKHLVVVATAKPLTDAQFARMEALAARRWDMPVELVAVTDERMVGGFRMDGGDRSVDTSIRSDIAAARAALTR